MNHNLSDFETNQNVKIKITNHLVATIRQNKSTPGIVLNNVPLKPHHKYSWTVRARVDPDAKAFMTTSNTKDRLYINHHPNEHTITFTSHHQQTINLSILMTEPKKDQHIYLQSSTLTSTPIPIDSLSHAYQEICVLSSTMQEKLKKMKIISQYIEPESKSSPKLLREYQESGSKLTITEYNLKRTYQKILKSASGSVLIIGSDLHFHPCFEYLFKTYFHNYSGRLVLVLGDHTVGLCGSLIQKLNDLLQDDVTVDLAVQKLKPKKFKFQLFRYEPYPKLFQANTGSIHIPKNRHEPLVSVITPTYNPTKDILMVQKSLIEQTIVCWEWIIVNDGSQEWDYDELEQDPRVRIVHQKNQGLPGARNNGLQYASTNYVVFLDDDDYLHPTALEKWMAVLNTEPEVDFVGSYVRGFGHHNYYWTYGFAQNKLNLKKNYLVATCMMRREVLDHVQFDQTMTMGCEDWDFWIRAANQGYWGVTIPEFLFYYRTKETRRDWGEFNNLNGLAEQFLQQYPSLQDSFPYIGRLADGSYRKILHNNLVFDPEQYKQDAKLIGKYWSPEKLRSDWEKKQNNSYPFKPGPSNSYPFKPIPQFPKYIDPNPDKTTIVIIPTLNSRYQTMITKPSIIITMDPKLSLELLNDWQQTYQIFNLPHFLAQNNYIYFMLHLINSRKITHISYHNTDISLLQKKKPHLSYHKLDQTTVNSPLISIISTPEAKPHLQKQTFKRWELIDHPSMAQTDYLMLLVPNTELDKTCLEKFYFCLLTEPEVSFVNSWDPLWSIGFETNQRMLYDLNLATRAWMVKKEDYCGDFLDMAKNSKWGVTIREVLCKTPTQPTYPPDYQAQITERMGKYQELWTSFPTLQRLHLKCNFQHEEIGYNKYKLIPSHELILNQVDVINLPIDIKHYRQTNPPLNGDDNYALKHWKTAGYKDKWRAIPYIFYQPNHIIDPTINSYPAQKSILFILPWLQMGGADRFNLHLLEYLKHNYHVTIVTTQNDIYKHDICNWLPEFQKHTDDIHMLYTFLSIHEYFDYVMYLCHSRNVDTILITNSMWGYQYVEKLRENWPHATYLSYVHMEQEEWKDGGYARMALDQEEHLDYNIVATNHLKNWMEARGGQKVHTIYIAIDTTLWQPSSRDRQAIREQHNIPDNKLVIMYAARLCDQKKPMLLMQILARLKHFQDKFTMLIIGNGPYYEQVDEFIRDNLTNVILLHNVSADIKKYYSTSDLFLLTSEWEGLPATFYEAMSMGLPIIGTDVGGIKELVEPNCGILIDKSNDQNELEDYVAALEEWIQNPKQFSKQDIQDQVAKFDLHIVYAQLVKQFIEQE